MYPREIHSWLSLLKWRILKTLKFIETQFLWFRLLSLTLKSGLAPSHALGLWSDPSLLSQP